VVVDISKHMHDWAVITPQIIESSGADIREGDILIRLITDYGISPSVLLRFS
jgi:hypothetical protein